MDLERKPEECERERELEIERELSKKSSNLIWETTPDGFDLVSPLNPVDLQMQCGESKSA